MTSRKEPGFTLTEIVLSLLMVGIGMTAVAPLFVQGTWMTASSEDMGSAGAAGVRRMELLRSTGFNYLTAGGSLGSNVTGFFDASDPEVRVRWTIVDNATPVTLKTITVRAIAIRQVVGLQKSFELTTLRSR